MTIDYRDDTHIVDGEVQIDKDKRLPEVEKLAKYVRTKMYGVDVRESLALAVELMSNIVVDDQNAYKQLEAKVDDLAQKWQDDTSNFKRLTEDEINRLIAEWNATVSGVTSDSEIINARVSLDGTTHSVIKERLDQMEMNTVQHRVMNKTYQLDHILQVTDLSTTSSDMKYEVVGQIEDVDESQFAYRSLRSRFIGINRAVIA
ncbi:hypothetical protein ESZ50_01390 [Weissella muntiaci]|uniref:Uncharacterized protein n=1 Tax=Weissella muntiaci TaxID=2508881 RepID=A0A6C2CA28_9LACO|nr:hypothetical protein [Weissella muntiaci]TYC50898.1 hypothetical protein ESZ50_01390 [Weissella muntiaci]